MYEQTPLHSKETDTMRDSQGIANFQRNAVLNEYHDAVRNGQTEKAASIRIANPDCAADLKSIDKAERAAV